MAALEEVVVTTRKQEESLQDVPVAVTAFSAKTIEEARIEGLDDVAALTPGLNFFNPIGDFLPVPVIRGVAPTDIFGEPNAAVFIDGVYAAGREGLNFALLDVDRIEVNKGPQSALYGRNAFSGAINYITMRPSDVFEGSADITVGNDGRLLGKGRVSGPLIGDTLKGQLGAAYDEFDGSYDNPVSSEGVGGHTFRTFQAGLDWAPTDRIGVELNGYYSDDDLDDATTTGQVANCEDDLAAQAAGDSRLTNFCGEIWDLDQLRNFQNAQIVGNPNIPQELQFTTGSGEIAKIAGATGEEREVTRVSLKATFDFEPGVLSALTGYSRVGQSGVQDGTRNLGYAFPFVYCDNVGGYADPPANTVPLCFDWATPMRFTTGQFVVSPEDVTEEISQELRFSSTSNDRFQYSVGGYYYHDRQKENAPTVLASAPSLPAGLGDPTGPGAPPPGAAFGPFPGLGLAIGDPAFRPWFTATSTLGLDEVIRETIDSYAAFATADVFVTEKLSLDFQLRYTYEDKDIYITAPLADVSEASTDKSFDFVTGRAGIKYNISDDWMIYAALSNGTKSGGFDADVVDVLTDANDPSSAESRIVIVPFDEEKIVSYEVGAKGATSDGRLRYDISVYRMDWSDIVIPQVFQNDPISGDRLEQPEGFNKNAGDATVWGWEMQADLAITDNLQAGGGASFTSAKMDSAKLESFAAFPSFAPDGDVSGNTVLRQPEWMTNVYLLYTRQAFGEWEWNARADVTYQDEYYGGLDNQWTVPAHTYVNLNLGLTTDRYTISLWGKNLFNDDSPTASFRDVYFGNTQDIYQQQSASSTPYDFFPWRFTTTHPKLRTYGVSFSMKFGDAG